MVNVLHSEYPLPALFYCLNVIERENESDGSDLKARRAKPLFETLLCTTKVILRIAIVAASSNDMIYNLAVINKDKECFILLN